MSKLLIKPTESNYEKVISFCDGVIIGVDGLSVNTPIVTKNIDKLLEIAKKNNKLVYVNLNKNMTNSDLDKLEETLIYLNDLVDGIVFYDIAVLNIAKRLKLNVKLIWNQEHFTTNFYTSNYYHSEGVYGMHISSDITLDEINEIIENSKMYLFLTVFGYLPMFNSFRHLVDNFMNTFNIEKKKTVYYMEEKSKFYPIIDDEYGTTVYSNMILNGLEEYSVLKNNDMSFVFDNTLIDDELFLEVLKRVYENNYDIDDLFSNLDKGFLYKETIYKVKK